MKAVIMAGGEGSRLRPLTCARPKPMVPVMNKPIMSYIVDLLKKHGIRDIGVTLQYMPEAISDYFGPGYDFDVNLKYFIEEVPLGTAGSVKNAQSFLDEMFIVISGDALTDFDLTRAIEFHKKKGAIATLVLTKVATPLEYGVVITDNNGSIRQFLEKPGWGEVFSDTVNTGIYILEPEVLSLFEPGVKFDFSKDLFPILLERKLPMFGVILPGYWCDIGDQQQYIQAHWDILDGKVELDIPGKMISPGIWIGDNVDIHHTTELEAPVVIGNENVLGAGVKISPYTIIGDNCMINNNSTIKRSIIWNNVKIASNASLRGAVISNRVQIQSNAGIYENAIVGSDCYIKERSIIKPGVKLWPQKIIEAGSIVQHSIVWGTRQPKKLFGIEGISGIINIELTPEFSAKLAAAYASTMGSKAKIVVSSDNNPPSQMLREAVSCGLQSTGVEVFNIGIGTTPMHRYAIRKYNYSGGIHVKTSSRDPEIAHLVFTNKRGSNISRNKERKIENILAREDFRRTSADRLSNARYVPKILEDYLKSITDNINKQSICKANYKVLIAYDRSELDKFIIPLCNELNLRVEHVNLLEKRTNPRWLDYQNILPDFSNMIKSKKADIGVIFDSNADRFILFDDQGKVFQDDLLTALIALIALRTMGGPVVVPVTAPKAIDSMAGKYSARVVRTKTAMQDLLEKLISTDEIHLKSSKNKKFYSQFLMNFDALAAFCIILDFMSEQNSSLSLLSREIPSFFLNKKDVQVPWEAKGRVIRRLVEERNPEEMELLDGVKVFHSNGWTLILPDPEEPLCRVFSEGASMEIAESLSDFYIDKINDIIDEEQEVS